MRPKPPEPPRLTTAQRERLLQLCDHVVDEATLYDALEYARQVARERAGTGTGAIRCHGRKVAIWRGTMADVVNNLRAIAEE